MKPIIEPFVALRVAPSVYREIDDGEDMEAIPYETIDQALADPDAKPLYGGSLCFWTLFGVDASGRHYQIASEAEPEEPRHLAFALSHDRAWLTLNDRSETRPLR